MSNEQLQIPPESLPESRCCDHLVGKAEIIGFAAEIAFFTAGNESIAS
jgi:hypothetical protein